MLSYYITSHGLGHATRSCDIIQTLSEKAPNLEIEVVSRVPEWFLKSRLNTHRVTFRQAGFDVGMVQLDALNVDVEATLHQLLELQQGRAETLESEARALTRGGSRLVVSDIPWLPFAAARLAGVPSVGVGNFSWEWIYQPFADSDARWQPLIQQIIEDYGEATSLIRLPFHHPMSSFPRKVDAPLVARAGRRRRQELAARCGLNPERPWALVLFAELRLEPEAEELLGAVDTHELLSPSPLGTGIQQLPQRLMPFADLVASVDVIVSKPGFGIVSDAIVNRKPLIYVEREQFREYPILETAIQRYLQYLHLPSASLYRGQLGAALEEISDRPPPEEILESDGGGTVVEHLLELM